MTRRYEDSDVRSSPLLRSLATAYAWNYEGTFEPLARAHQLLKDVGEIDAHTARVVLNCMRNDNDPGVRESLEALPPLPLVVEKPQPTPPLDLDAAERRWWGPKGRHLPPFGGYPEKACVLAEAGGPHEAHDWLDEVTTRDKIGAVVGRTTEYRRCHGVPWAINRSNVASEARLKVLYVAAANGQYIHHRGSEFGAFQWAVPKHKEGWAVEVQKFGAYWTTPATLVVATLCGVPVRIKSPVLLAEEHLPAAMGRRPWPQGEPPTPGRRKAWDYLLCGRCRGVLETTQSMVKYYGAAHMAALEVRPTFPPLG